MTERVRIDVWQRVPLPPHILQFFWILALTRIVIGTDFPKRERLYPLRLRSVEPQRKTPFFPNRGIGESKSPTRWPDGKNRKRSFCMSQAYLAFKRSSPPLPHSSACQLQPCWSRFLKNVFPPLLNPNSEATFASTSARKNEKTQPSGFSPLTAES